MKLLIFWKMSYLLFDFG